MASPKKGAVHELVEMASGHDADVVTVLRKALVIASRLQASDFEEWIRHELHGYPKGSELPDYRIVKGDLRAYNPANGVWMPVDVRHHTETLKTLRLNEGVTHLQATLDEHDGSGHIMCPLPQSTLDTSRGMVSDPIDKQFEPTRLLGAGQLRSVIESVRGTLLEWAVELEKRGIVGEDMIFSDEEVQKAKASTNVHIENFHGIMGDVTSQSVQIGDYASIYKQLKAAGIPQSERNEIESVIDGINDSESREKQRPLAKRGLEWTMNHAKELGSLADTLRGWFEAFTKGE